MGSRCKSTVYVWSSGDGVIATWVAFVALAISVAAIFDTVLDSRLQLHPKLIKKAIRQRFIVTLPSNEGVFSGVMVEYDQKYWIFDNCHGIPTRPGETADEWPGRLWVIHDCDPPPYLQEITPDAQQKFMAQGREV
jgi:hypothetical protein